MRSVQILGLLLVAVALAAGIEAQPAPSFVFQNNFWVNLHQFLYAEAGRRQAGRATLQPAREDARAAWQSALDAYAGLLTRELTFDPQLVAANDALARIEGDALPLRGIDAAVRAVLDRAAPVYRVEAWPRHRQANQAWIAAMQPRVDRLGPALTRALARAYHTDWPAEPILIDVSADAGPFGGYTTNDGPAGFAAHATIAPGGAGAEGDMGIETIFHEASHAVDASIMRLISAESASQHVRTPRLLWHALIFYTAGELVRRELGMVGDSHYMPYAYRFDVYSKGMDTDRAALEEHWQPFLDGTVPFEDALRNLVRAATR